MTNDERAQIRAEVVREALELINMRLGGAPGHHRYQNALLELLPKPDPAKELVEAYENDCSLPFLHPMDIVKIERLHFARWLIDTGRLKV